MNQVLQIEDLHKKYGRIHAVNGLSMQVNQGEIFGILGPNGSGKTTTLGMLLKVINKTSGQFSWFGQPASHKIRQKIGAILETPSFYPYLSGHANLEVVAAIKGVKKQRVDLVLREVGLYDRRYDKFRTYSLGMKQRLAIAAALIPEPEVLILDEPTNGLDPKGIKEIRDLITHIGSTGKTIILASHLLNEVQKVCTHFAVLNFGKKVYQGKVNQALGGETLYEINATDLQHLQTVVTELGWINIVDKEPHCLVVSLPEGRDATQLNQALAEKNIFLSHLATRKKNLENKFLEILSQSNA
ncbi:MAG: ABC transporter ATP-binding protein [Cyclobacteriaceae bacterium]